MDSYNQIDSDEIYLSEIFNIIKRNFIKIIIMGILFGLISFGVTTLLIDKQYVSSGTMIVNNRKTDNTEITGGEISTAQSLTNVFSIVIKSEPVLGQVINNLKLNMEVEQLSKMVSVSSVDQTQIMKVSVKSNDPQLSSRIANEILDSSPEIIVDTVEAGSVKIISVAHVNEKAVSPNVLQNILIATTLGLLLSAGGFILMNILDKTFKSEEDIEKYLDIPILGVIPDVETIKGAAK